MPIVPSVPVSAEPLMPSPPAASDRILSNPVSPAQEVYIHRQRPVAITPAANEPINSQALLEATNNMQPVTAIPAPAAGGGLVINPYPLQNNPPQTSQGGNMGALSVEQAMMEQTGMLRPVAVPGQSGQTDRARISARYDNNPQAQYLDRAPVVPRPPAPATFSISPNITPIPGGEGAPIQSLERALMPEPAPIFGERHSPSVPPAPAPVPAAYTPPAAPQNAGGYAEVVGFGRDLPLALALSQVIPPDYNYAFGQNINAGASVSWQGGKPWNQVLDEMLAPAGMKAIIQNGQVTIQSASS